jgi:hypothetical protein
MYLIDTRPICNLCKMAQKSCLHHCKHTIISIQTGPKNTFTLYEKQVLFHIHLSYRDGCQKPSSHSVKSDQHQTKFSHKVPAFCTTVPPFWTILVSMSFFVSSFHEVSTQNSFSCNQCDVTSISELLIPQNCSPTRMGTRVSCLRFFFGDSDRWSLASTCLEYSFPDASCKHQQCHVHRHRQLSSPYM